MDLFVANDTVQNFLFMNRGKGKWEEIGLASEVGFRANGQPRSGMGVDAADFDGDGWQDLFVANVDQEMFSLYRNNKDESFTDVAHLNSVSEATRLLSGWGLKFFDYDNDGQLDLFLANGHPDDMIDNYGGQVKYKEPLLLFQNDGRRLQQRQQGGGAGLHQGLPGPRPGRRRLRQRRPDRRASWATTGRPPLLLKNNAGAGNHWLGLRLEGSTVQSRRHRRPAHLVGGRGEADAAQDRRRQLSLVPRSSRGARARDGHDDRLARDPVAGPQRQGRANRERAHRSLRPDRGRQGDGCMRRISSNLQSGAWPFSRARFSPRPWWRRLPPWSSPT